MISRQRRSGSSIRSRKYHGVGQAGVEHPEYVAVDHGEPGASDEALKEKEGLRRALELEMELYSMRAAVEHVRGRAR